MNDIAPTFIPPCIPTLASKLPTGPGWLHEPKFEGWRLQIVKDGDHVAVFPRGKHDISKRLGSFTRALVPCARSCVIDAELLSSNGNFWGSTALSVEHITIAAFDLMHLDGVDLRPEQLVDRKARLAELVTRAGLPSLIQVDGPAIYWWRASAVVLLAGFIIGAIGLALDKWADRSAHEVRSAGERRRI